VPSGRSAPAERFAATELLGEPPTRFGGSGKTLVER
jgi:hypothetical protein